MTAAALPSTRRTALAAVLFALTMLGAAYAAVPLYRLFCQATGFGGTTQRATAAPAATPAAAGTISVRFDGNVSPGMPWQFRPVKTQLDLPIGRQQLALYRATNLAATATTGSAVFNVSPDVAGKYFVKIQCFCFNEQTLRAGESVDMPVVFYVDPAILKDPVARKVSEITLSYTFYPVDKPVSAVRAIRVTDGQAVSKG